MSWRGHPTSNASSVTLPVFCDVDLTWVHPVRAHLYPYVCLVRSQSADPRGCLLVRLAPQVRRGPAPLPFAAVYPQASLRAGRGGAPVASPVPSPERGLGPRTAAIFAPPVITPRHPRRVEGREGASAGCDIARLATPAPLPGQPGRRPREVAGWVGSLGFPRRRGGALRPQWTESARSGILAGRAGAVWLRVRTFLATSSPRGYPACRRALLRARSPHARLLVLALGFPYSSFNLPACRGPSFDSCVGKIPWRRKWQPTPVFLLGESHGQKSLAGYSP